MTKPSVIFGHTRVRVGGMCRGMHRFTSMSKAQASFHALSTTVGEIHKGA